jgi:hypothetical protein
VIDILNNAAYTTYDVKKREEGEGNELSAQEVRRFPYQTITS